MSDSRVNASSPIGVFDSGVGGLSVLREIRAMLPGERLIYVADSRYAPYGSKSPEFIRDRSLCIGRFLTEKGAKAIVIACNTGTAAAATHLREALEVPVVAMEPAVKPAAEATRSGVVGVLATVGTLESARFAALLERFGREVEVVTQACPGLVERIESGDLCGPETRRLVEEFTAPLVLSGADTIVLGCTHYPFLASVISEVVGPRVALVHTGEAVARQVRRVLMERGLLFSGERSGEDEFWTSGDSTVSARVISLLWGSGVTVRSLPDGVAAPGENPDE